MWHYCETGSGRPLVLLHGIGMSHTAWTAVTPFLRHTRRVIAFDIAGFGSTPPLPEGTLPTIANLVDGLERSLDEMDVDVPIDMAGNSLGGGMALEAARRGIARRVVAISPIGLWSAHPAPHVPYVFGGMRFMARRFPALLKAPMRSSWLREAALAVPLSVGSRRMSASDARRAVEDLAASPAFDETFEHTRSAFSGRGITVPVTVAFGDRDWILPRGSQLRTALPMHTRWVRKHGWGHVPMWVDPLGVSQLILEGLRSGDRVRPVKACVNCEIDSG
jgi:pimeloyl-ACP methyl ester carboxylesterase